MPTIVDDFADAYRHLGAAQKAGAGVPVYTRYVNRRLGRVAAALAAAIHSTPNQVTLLSAALSAVGLVMVAAVPTSTSVVTGATVLLVVAYALDSADGQLARLTGAGGPSGEWLDHVVDAARNLAFHLVILIALYRFADVSATTLLLPLGFSVVASTRFFSQILGEQLRIHYSVSKVVVPGQDASASQLRRSLIQLPSDTGVLNGLILLLAAPRLFVPCYAAFLVLNAGLAGASGLRRFRELTHAALDTRRRDA